MTSIKQSSTAVLAGKILCTGLFVGTLDILTALAKYYLTTGKNPLFIFRYIASGILGKDAFSGGTGTILTGLLLHYGIALSFTLLFCFLYHNLRFGARHKILTGIVYGIFIWAIMTFLVVPLSHAPKGPFDISAAVKELLILIFMIGLPLAFLAGRFIPVKKN